MLIKAGVDISRLNREIRRALQITYHLLAIQNFSFIVTSTYEGNHSSGSLYYTNDAFDFTTTFTDVKKLFKDLRFSLGPDFNVVDEVDHIHVEYDPK
ncbi:hypothetical protein ES702_05045 [subsurface metagenome]